MGETVVKVKGLTKEYKIYESSRDILTELVTRKQKHTVKRVLDNVSFELERGDILGVIGRNGAGKSTMLKILAGTLDKTAGEVEISGKISAILELGTGFHPEYSGRDNIIMGGMSIGMSRKEMEEKSDAIIEFSELQEVIDQPFKTYSSGMQARLTFSTAISVEPDIFIVDEALAAGDAFFITKCLKRISGICKSGATVLFVSHSLDMVRRLCNKAMYLEKGRIVKIGEVTHICAEYELLAMQKQSDLKQLEIQKNGFRAHGDILKINNFRLLNSDYKEQYSFYQHDLLNFDIEIVCNEDGFLPVAYLKFIRTDGIFVTSWLNTEPYMHRIPAFKKGINHIQLYADDLLLGDGSFYVSVYIFRYREGVDTAFYTDPLCTWENVIVMDVQRHGRPLSTFFDQPIEVRASACRVE